MKRSRKKILLIVYRLILVGMIIYGALGIYRILSEVNAGKAKFDSGVEAIRPALTDPSMRVESLQLVNPDIAGWIIVEGTEIDFPILMDMELNARVVEIFASGGDLGDIRRGSDKPISEILYKYLYYDYAGRPSVTGSIVADVRCKADLSGSYVMVYGHNVGWSGVMFSDLEEFKKPEFYEQHKTAVLFSAAGREDLELAVCANISGYNQEVFDLNMLHKEEGFDTAAAIRALTEASMYPLDEPVPEDLTRCILLSTCFSAQHPEDPARLVLLYRVKN